LVPFKFVLGASSQQMQLHHWLQLHYQDNTAI